MVCSIDVRHDEDGNKLKVSVNGFLLESDVYGRSSVLSTLLEATNGAPTAATFPLLPAAFEDWASFDVSREYSLETLLRILQVSDQRGRMETDEGLHHIQFKRWRCITFSLEMALSLQAAQFLGDKECDSISHSLVKVLRRAYRNQCAASSTSLWEAICSLSSSPLHTRL